MSKDGVSGSAGGGVAAERCNEDRVRSWLRDHVSTYLCMAREELDTDADLRRYGLDSLGAEELMVAVEETWGPGLSTDAVLRHPTIASLARQIVSCARGSAPVRLASLAGLAEETP